MAHGHYASPEIKEKLDVLDPERADLEKAWVQRRMMLDQCLELQVPALDGSFLFATGFQTRCFVPEAPCLLTSLSPSLAVPSGLRAGRELDGCPRGLPEHRRQRGLARQCGGSDQKTRGL